MIKKITALLASAALMVTMAASLASAAPFTVYGSESPDKYLVFSEEYNAWATPVKVKSPAVPWTKSGNWITFNNPDQAWPMGAGSGSLPGLYWYITAFDLAGFDPSTAMITGSWASDNSGALYINNFVISNGTVQLNDDISHFVGNNNGFGALAPFEITSGFLPGFNLLTFLVQNDPYGDEPGTNPTGLLVNIDKAEANPVPEPGTMVLLGTGLLGFVLFNKRRNPRKRV